MAKPTKNRRWRRYASLATRLIGVAIVAILIVRERDKVGDAWQLIRASSFTFWALAVVLQLASLFVSTVRLSLIIRALGHSISVPALLADLVAATALNAALLMGAGDVYRISRVNAVVDSWPTSSGAVVLDRLLGLVTVGVVAGLASLGLARTGVDIQARWLLAIAIAAALIAVGAWSQRNRFRVIREASRPLVALAKRPPIAAVVLVLSLIVVALWILSIIAIARALAIDVPLLALVFAAPIVTLATILPISIGGIGVREAGYSLLLAPHGVAVTSAIALGAMQYSLLLPTIAGGVIILLRRARRRKSEGTTDAELGTH